METSILFISGMIAEPAVLLGLMALIGLLVQKKTAIECIQGVVKSILGFMVLGAGAGLVVSSLGHFSTVFQQAFDIHGVVPNNEAIIAVAQQSFGREMALIMLFAMVVNILIARFTPWKFIFLTGHHTLFMSMLVAVILASAGMQGIMLVGVGAIVVGTLMVLCPAIIHPYMKQVMGSDEVAFGHFSMLSQLVASVIGSRFGNQQHSTETLFLPKGLLFMRDTPVAISFTMSIIFIGVCLLAGADQVQAVSEDKQWLVFSIMQSISFAAGVYIILQGVRMIIAEIVPAFKGISDILVPNAKPALDCPVVFPRAPNAVLIGFISSFTAGIISALLLYWLNMTVVIPSVVPHFFVGAASGVFGNATGGLRGAILGAFVQGVLITFLPVFLIPMLGELGFADTTFSDPDFVVVGMLLGWVVR